MTWAKVGAVFSLIFIVLGSLYVGVGGMERVELIRLSKEAAQKPQKETHHGDEVFYNPESLNVFRMEEKVEQLFPWIKILPSFAALALTAVSFGMLGGATRVLKELVIDSISLEFKSVYMYSAFGFLIGIMILGVSYILPAALTQQTDIQLDPSTLLFLCYFGGLFSLRFFKWIEGLFERIFPEPE
ncbi:hypothetical protein [Gimesia panareensis]|uniref:hypothetical protein n=1 Tax=Gimesia panareensis TaxID=2527978 RepID=UPI00118BF5AF|nr:hypothetical protein [Gimesia panareensis]QDU50247.1 hypothetical protein Pan110_25910 [Gimesia panareensis]